MFEIIYDPPAKPETRPVLTLPEVAARATEYATQAKADATRKAYARSWRAFAEWCDGHQLRALPAAPETVGLYLSAFAATHKINTCVAALAAISVRHRTDGHPLDTRHPAIKDVIRGIRRTAALAGIHTEKKTALLAHNIHAMVDSLPDTTAGIRDRALLLLGFAGAFRRGELVGLNVEDLSLRPQGYAVTIRRGKTDQEGAGREVAILRAPNSTACPVRAIDAWLERSLITTGPLFRPVDRFGVISPKRLGDKTVAYLIKRSAEKAGLDPALYAGHSLRSGFATTAALNGASESSIMRQTGHRSFAVVRGYIRGGGLFHDTAAGKLGL